MGNDLSLRLKSEACHYISHLGRLATNKMRVYHCVDRKSQVHYQGSYRQV